MTTYNTGNPVGSTDARDLSDNAQNLDLAVNGPGSLWTDRFGNVRPTWNALAQYAGPAYDASTYGGLEAALTALGAGPATIQYTGGQTFTQNWAIPSGIELLPLNGAVINHGAYTISYAGSTARWPLTKIFNGTGAVTGLEEAFPEWFALNSLPGVTDMTDATQKALDSSKNAKLGTTSYRWTDSLIFRDGYSLRGQSRYPSTKLQANLSSEILTTAFFEPSVEKDLFDITTLSSTNLYVSKIHISGIHIIGNTTAGITTSRYGINNKAAYSTFENLGFERFQDGIYCNFTLGNTYKNIYLGFMSHACIYTSTDVSTTDVFSGVTMFSSPWGAILRAGIAFRFDYPLFEGLTLGGVNIYKEVSGASFNQGYAENNPVADATYGMFRINYDGVTLGSGVTSIAGGYYGGSTGGSLYGSFLSVGASNYINNVSVSDLHFSRFTNGIVADAVNCDAHTIHVEGISYSTVTTPFVNPKKGNLAVIYGMVPEESSGVNLPSMRAFDATVNQLHLYDSAGAGSGTVTVKSGTLAADEFFSLDGWAAGDAGILTVTMNDGATVHEFATYSVSFVSGATSVKKVSGTANTGDTNVAGRMNAIPSGTSVWVSNRLGVTVSYRCVLTK